MALDCPHCGSAIPITPAIVKVVGQYTAANRRQVERPCTVCGRSTIGTLKRRYCSPACRKRAYVQRHAVA